MTPEEARRELARRELARRSGANPQQASNAGKFGAITREPSMVEKIGRNLTLKETRPIGILPGVGLAMSAAGIPEEEAFPMVGQIAGTPGGFGGSVGGATLGQAAKQVARGARGQEMNMGDIPREAATTGLIEGVTRGAGKVFFRKQNAGELLKKLGSKLGLMKENISKSEAFIPSSDFVGNLEAAYNSLPDPLKGGKAGSAIKKWINYGKSTPYLSAKDMILMEESLGNVAEFGAVKKGFFQPAKDVPNPAMNRLAKEARTKASDVVEGLANKSGEKEFGSVSKKVSKILQQWPDLDPSKGYGNFGSRLVASSMAGMVTGSPLVGAGTYLAEKTIQSPEFRNAAFNIVRNPVSRALGTGSKMTLSQLARNSNSNKKKAK